jgi:nitrate/TMAO reductase-like tetraheme cytochrome c subunit
MSRAVIWSFLVVSLVLLSIPAASHADETVCLQCHAGLSGHLGEPVAAWQTSVHAENGISCHDCHGGDPTDMAMAMSPERGFIGVPEYTEVPDFCGRCHVGVAEEYKAGAHGQAIEEGGAQCVVCHSNHAVQRASLDLINEEDCTRCHSYDRAALIRLALVETDTMIKDVEQELDRLYRLGFSVDEMQGTLFNQRNVFHRTFHGVDVDRVRKETGGVQAELSKVQGEIAEIDNTLGKRKLWGSVVIGLFILAGVILLLVRKAYEEEGG